MLVVGIMSYKQGEFTSRIDVLDLLINILREHEEKIDLLVERLETVADWLDPQKHTSEGIVSEADLSRRFYEPL